MSNLDEFRSSRISTWPIVLLRVYAGVFFLYFGFGKLRRGNFEQGLSGFVGSKVDGNPENQEAFGFFKPVLEFVLENPGVFAFLVTWGELLIGLALIAGLATRYASIAGAVMVASFWMAKGQGLFNAQNHDAVWFVIFVVLAGLHAGRTLSLDQKLAGRFRFLA